MIRGIVIDIFAITVVIFVFRWCVIEWRATSKSKSKAKVKHKFFRTQWWRLLFRLGFSLDSNKRSQIAYWITRNVTNVTDDDHSGN